MPKRDEALLIADTLGINCVYPFRFPPHPGQCLPDGKKAIR
jgi:hypothetical protein